jgi:hypothetical protein
MEFSEREIADLAAFFAKRFPSYEQRAVLCEAAGLAGEVQLTGDARVAWLDVIRVATSTGRLTDLVERAIQQRPDDENLREMAAVMGSGKRWRARRWSLLLGTPMVLAAALLLWSPWSGEAPAPSEPEADGVAMAEAEHEPSTPISPPEEEPGAEDEPELEPEPAPELASAMGQAGAQANDVQPEPVPVPEPAPEPEPAPVPEPVPVPEPAPAVAPKPTPKPAGAVLRCEGPPGEVIGYWYAGETSPGGVGADYTVDGGLNVRVDYPDVHNDFDARSALVCTLGHGWRLRLGHEPIAVPGGAYWVPLASDDIVER